MSLTTQEQFKKFLEDSKNVLVLIPENPSADAVGSAWALYFFLENKKLIPTIAFSNNLSKKFEFLPRPQKILSEISGARDFVLSFDISRNKIIGIKSEEKDGKFMIYLTPEKGAIDPRDFSFILAKFKYDLVVVIDSPDLEKLGKIYADNTDLFFEVPVINIDRRSDNDNFGQINLIDVTASSCSEILTRSLEELEPDLIDKNVATCLLSGIIGATDSFQKKNTTPKSLATAAMLMDKGADQQEIIRWLYKTHPLHILKLWGRAMAKLNWNPDSQLVWSEISLEDFIQSRASSADLTIILEKLQESYSEGKIFMTLYNDTPVSAMALVKTADIEIAKKIYLAFGGEIKRGVLEIRFDKVNLSEIGKAVSEKIKNVTSNS
jgi:nanoRNase/pAp phosphatase (c-di-AMP/oligoRNAs hydrolase)